MTRDAITERAAHEGWALVISAAETVDYGARFLLSTTAALLVWAAYGLERVHSSVERKQRARLRQEQQEREAA